jgi:hypothetical protein
MPQQDNKHLYATVRRLCELEFGVWTQCCLADHVKKGKPKYIANVISKINANLGGANHPFLQQQVQGLLGLYQEIGMDSRQMLHRGNQKAKN